MTAVPAGDLPAIAAYGAYHDLLGPRTASEWMQQTEEFRANWRAAVDAARMIIAAQQPQPAPASASQARRHEAQAAPAAPAGRADAETAGLLRADLDDAERTIARYREQVTRITADNDRLHAALRAQPGKRQAAPELAAAMAETRKVREILALALNHFRATGNGWKASVRVVELARWYDQAGIPRPQELRGVR